MTEVDEQYDPDERTNRGHSIAAIRSCAWPFRGAAGLHSAVSFRAFDVFAGYLVFDALIAHVDRHDRNWAVLVRPPETAGDDALCASFDHAASFGFTLSDEERESTFVTALSAGGPEVGKLAVSSTRPGRRWQTLVEASRGGGWPPARRRPASTGVGRVLSVERDSVEAVVAACSGPLGHHAAFHR